MSPAERRARGFAAKALLNDPTIIGAIDEIENDIRSEWERTTGWWQTRKRERLAVELRWMKSIRQRLASFAGQSRD